MRLSANALFFLAAASAMATPSIARADYTLRAHKVAVINVEIQCVRSRSAAVDMYNAMHQRDTAKAAHASVGSYLLEPKDVVQALHVDGFFIEVQYLSLRNGGASGRCWLPNSPKIFRKSKYAPNGS